MKVLWLCNIMLPVFAEANGLAASHREGWLSGSFERLIKGKESGIAADIDLAVCFPAPEAFCGKYTELSGVRFYGFAEDLDHPEIYDEALEARFREVLADYQPDMVHIFGSEFPHALAMVRAYDRPERTLIGIQGICERIADAYMADLPYSVRNHASFRDRVRHDSLRDQQEKFFQRARMEREAIQGSGHIAGRTAFDREVTSGMNPEAIYHPLNETLRGVFYRGQWRADRIEPYSIFLSQGDYPLKGFHYMLEAMPRILKDFPRAKLYVAGNSIITGGRGKRSPILRPLWISSYGRYLLKLIKRLDLTEHVVMLGPLDAAAMKARYLRSHVFVCPSALENSPNSLGEAMLLGMPVVAAKVGGIPDLLSDGEDGILFPAGKVDELAEGVRALFYDRDMAAKLGAHAARTAAVTHNPDTNFMRLLEIYRAIG